MANGHLLACKALSPEADKAQRGIKKRKRRKPSPPSYRAAPLCIYFIMAKKKKYIFCAFSCNSRTKPWHQRCKSIFFPPTADWYAQSAFRLASSLQQAPSLSANSGADHQKPDQDFLLQLCRPTRFHTREHHADMAALRMLFWTCRECERGEATGLGSDRGFALRGSATVIGVSFKASASPGRMVSKLTAFAGYFSASASAQRLIPCPGLHQPCFQRDNKAH